MFPPRENDLQAIKAAVLQDYGVALGKKKAELKNDTDSKKRNGIIKDLMKRDDIVIKVADKDKQFVVAPKESYIDQVETMLADNTTYEEQTRNPLPRMTNETEDLICHLSQKYPWIEEKCSPYHPRIPEFYCTWKTHKNADPPPLRPVTSQVDSPSERLGHFVTYVLNQALDLVKVNVKNSQSLRKKLETQWTDNITEKHVMFTADVKSLYTNVPLEDGHRVIMQFLRNNTEHINTNGMELADFDLLLKSVIQAGYFRFDSNFYRQIDGLGMGVKPAPPFAIIYVYCTVEMPLLYGDLTYTPNGREKPSHLPEIESWDRYVDDCFGIIEGDELVTKELFEYINSLNNKIQFTYESSKDVISFLDLNIHCNTNESKLDFSLFVKPSSKDIFLNFTSAHPKSIILNSAKNEIKRAIRNSSTPHLTEQSIKRVCNMLLRNDFPESVVTKLVEETQNPKKTPDSPKKQPSTYLTLPYISEQTNRKVYYTLRKHNRLDDTRVIFKPGRKLEETLTKSSLHPTKCNKRNADTCYQCDANCMTKNICYELCCNSCGDKYIGETGRFKRNRIWEHFQSVQHANNNTAMGKHYREKHGDIPIPEQPFNVTIKRRCKDYVERQIWQSVLIKRENPVLNTQLAETRAEGEWVKNTWRIL